MKRLAKPRLIRAMMRKGIISPNDKEGIRLIERRLAEHQRYVKMNTFYHDNRGTKVIDRFRSWMLWVWKYREEIFRILGIMIVFLEDGSPIVKDAEEDVKIELETVHGVKEEVEVPDTTPDGEPVEDFVWETEDAEGKGIRNEEGRKGWQRRKREVEDALDEMVQENQRLGFYEVQPEREGDDSSD